MFKLNRHHNVKYIKPLGKQGHQLFHSLPACLGVSMKSVVSEVKPAKTRNLMLQWPLICINMCTAFGWGIVRAEALWKQDLLQLYSHAWAEQSQRGTQLIPSAAKNPWKRLYKQQGEPSSNGLLNHPRMCHIPSKSQFVGAEESQIELPFLPP